MFQLFKTVVKQYCKGKSLDEIGERKPPYRSLDLPLLELENTVMASGDLTFFARSMAYLEPFEKCLQDRGTDPQTVLFAAGRAAKATFKDMFEEVRTLFLFMHRSCPLMSTDRLQIP